MQGEQLLQDPSFAKALSKSPFKSGDMPGLSSSIANTFERLDPAQKAALKRGLSELEAMTEQQLVSLSNLLSYISAHPDQYPKLIAQLIKSGAFEGKEIPQKYDPRFIAIANSLVGFALQKKVAKPKGYASGGVASLKDAADRVKSAGRNGDTMLAHINPLEAHMLRSMGGSGKINPETGLPEFGFLSGILGTVLSIGATFLLGPAGLGLSPILAGAIGSGAAALVTGAKPADALKSALLGGVTSGIMAGFSGSGSFVDNALGVPGTSYSNPIMDKVKEWTGIGTGSGSTFGSLFGGDSVASSSGVSPEDMATSTWGDKAIPTPPVRPDAATLDAALAAQPTTEAAVTPVTSTGSPSSSKGISGLFDSAKGFVKENPLVSLGLAGGALLALSSAKKDTPAAPLIDKSKTADQLIQANPSRYAFDTANFAPRYKPVAGRLTPPGGYLTSPTGFTYDQFPGGGVMNARVGGPITGPGTGTSDSIPARLSDGEFVMTAAAVRGAGHGNRKAGAQKMYDLMHKFERMA